MSETAAIFAVDGPLAEQLPRYEPRAPQLRMAAAVERTLDRGGVLLAEAGTGTGKTLAYLVPALLSGSRVVVSTGTKNLQEQIFFKDLALLARALDLPIEAAYLKGQDNYACRRRCAEFLSSPRALAHTPGQVADFEGWYRTTATGDRMELAALGDEDPLWREICSTQETRIGPKCRHFEACFVTLARREAQAARLLVVNHHLYFADLATRLRGGSILPDHDAVIFDEAHLIEDVATDFFSLKVSAGRIDRLLNDTGIAVQAARLADDSGAPTRDRSVAAARALAADMFAAFRGATGRAPLEPQALPAEQRNAYHRLDAALESLEHSLRGLAGRDEGIDQLIERYASARADLSQILDRTATGFVHWLETRARSTTLGASPIDVSAELREGIFFRVPAVVLTSATLSTGGDFGFLRSRLGIDFDSDELSEPAPFDFPRQACLYVPTDLPDPREPRFAEHAGDVAAGLIAITAGGALVLCTSIKNMRLIHQHLTGRVPGPLLLQGTAPKSRLIDRFLEDRAAVLVATTSFWQGVDLPGDALRLVVIDKLPFASPADPIVAARIAHLEERGQRPFIDYQLPHAALTLKQGFGRLIRTREDRGIVAILDRRLLTMGYAKTFFASLPPCPVLAALDEVERWWLNPKPAPARTAARAG